MGGGTFGWLRVTHRLGVISPHPYAICALAQVVDLGSDDLMAPCPECYLACDTHWLRRTAIRPYLGMFLGVVVVSCAAILIRLAEAPPLVIAAYRMGIASLVLSPLALPLRREWRRMRTRDIGLALLSGLFLALHFALWITSLDYTSVASSVVLVTTTPLFAGVGAHFLRQDRLTGRTVAGILISLAGGMVIGFGDLSLGWRPLLGDTLALLGAMAAASYFLIGRRLRPNLSILGYIGLVYPAAAVVLLLMVWGWGNSFTGYSGQTYLMLLLLALGPQLLGHSALNWALGYFPATLVAIAVLAEPVVATVLAIFVLGESPTAAEVGGGVLILVGIYVALRWSRRASQAAAPAAGGRVTPYGPPSEGGRQ